jgi:ABC-type sugar transport system ATPase subunit
MLRVARVSSGEQVVDGSLEVFAGEVVGVYGLVGAGRSELAETIFGLRPRTGGTITVDGEELPVGHAPHDAMAARVALLPEDRSEAGLFLERTIAENVCAARLDRFGSVLLDEREMAADSRRAIAEFNIQWGPEMVVGNLSGGNQQKVLFGRWWSTAPKVLIVDEPTRGVDVGTKADIHRAIRELAEDGTAVLLISSEMPEVLGMSDRIYVMAGGRIVEEFSDGTPTEDALLVSSSVRERELVEGKVS